MRRVLLLPVVAALLAGTAVLPPPSSASADDGGPPPPGTAVEAPALPGPRVPFVDMSCETGQLDLNTATVDDIVAALELADDERDVAVRIVAARPYNGLPDLLAVAGVGPGRLGLLDPANFCVTPYGGLQDVLTRVPEDACPADGDLVDINSATADEIERVLPGEPRLTRPTAERVAARAAALPFPDLKHLVAVPGIGPGTLAKIKDSLCLTPGSILAQDLDGHAVAATFVTQNQGVRFVLDADTGQFGLGIPAGTLDVEHAWARIALAEPQRDLGVPVADMHIYGAWGGSGGLVWATVPTDGLGAEGWGPALVHVPNDGSAPEWFAGASAEVSVAGDTVTAPLKSLSRLQGLSVPLTYFTGTTIDPQTALAVLPKVWDFSTKVLDYRTEAPTCPTSDVDYSYTGEVSGVSTDNGELPFCAWVSGDDGRLRVKFAQNRNFVARIAIVDVEGAGGEFADGLGGAPSTPVGWAIQSILQLAAGDNVNFIAPGGVFETHLNPPSSSLQAALNVDAGSTFAYVVADLLIDAFMPDKVAYATARVATECLYPIIANDLYKNGISDEQAVGNLYDCLEPGLDDAFKALGKDTVGTAIAGVLLFADTGITLLDSLDAGIQSAVAWVKSEPQILVEYAVNDSAGPFPITDQYGRAAVQQCINGGEFDPRHGYTPFALDQECQNAYYGGIPDTGGNDPQDNSQGGTRYQATDPDGTIPTPPNTLGKVLIRGRGSVLDGYVYANGDFGRIESSARIDCLALSQGIPVRYDTPASVFDAWVEAPGPVYPLYGGGTCTTPVASWLGAGLSNYILRDVDTGAAYLLDGSGTTIHHIPDGGTFNCLAQRYLVRETSDPTGRVTSGLIFEPYAVGTDATCE